MTSTKRKSSYAPFSGKEKKKAVALQYNPEKDKAPKAVAKGVGEVAERILALAGEHNIPIHENADLVEILSHLKLFQEIPPATYVVVAEILSFIYRTNESLATHRKQ